ncbi:MAG TPA: hypothetical protein VG871_23885, partial [Vicinamibacterales bacterium]|nr:hypothetical protein [Vicinamibacterales bacterium]
SGQAPAGAARASADRLHGVLQVLSAAGYGRVTDLDRLTLDMALDGGMEAVRKLRLARLWPGSSDNEGRVLRGFDVRRPKGSAPRHPPYVAS